MFSYGVYADSKCASPRFFWYPVGIQKSGGRITVTFSSLMEQNFIVHVTACELAEKRAALEFQGPEVILDG